MYKLINANSRKLRKIFELQEYDYILQHIPGKENQDADLLSRINNINNINFGIEYQEIINFSQNISHEENG